MSATKKFYTLLPALVVFAFLAPTAGAHATRDQLRARKCAYYKEMVEVALASVDASRMTPRFAAEHAAFIAGGCFAGEAACRQNRTDFAFADMLTMMTVSANMGSTFTPFRCPVGAGG